MFIEAKGPSIAWYPPHAVSLSSLSRSPFAADCSISIEWRTVSTHFSKRIHWHECYVHAFFACCCFFPLFDLLARVCVRPCALRIVPPRAYSRRSRILFSFVGCEGFYWTLKTIRARITMIHHLLRVIFFKTNFSSEMSIFLFWSIDYFICTWIYITIYENFDYFNLLLFFFFLFYCL